MINLFKSDGVSKIVGSKNCRSDNGSCKISYTEIDTAQIRICKVSFSEIGFPEIGSPEIGSIEIGFPEGGRVWVEICRDANEVAIRINDNGSGIPEADLPFIFNRFWRGEKSRARASGGAGLGLAISKLLMEGQEGGIVARNLPGGGLQVCAFIPTAG